MFAVHTGQITRSDYMEITGVPTVTASRDLARLSQLGWLVAGGKTRSRVYLPAPTEAPERQAGGADEQLSLPETGAGQG